MFCIRHFAGFDVYRSETGFLEKIKDEMPSAAKVLFETAPNQLVRDIFALQLGSSKIIPFFQFISSSIFVFHLTPIGAGAIRWAYTST